MIKLKSLELVNFTAFQNAFIDFEENRTACLVAPMGNGKTFLLFESLSWVLFGKTRKQTDASLVKYGEQYCQVSLTLKKQSDEIVIKRKCEKDGMSGKTTITIYINGEVLQIKNKSDLQQAIADIIEVDYEVFTNSTLLLQNDFKGFFTMTGAEKKQFLMKMFNLDRFAEYESVVKEKLINTEKKIAMYGYSVADYEQKKEDLDTYNLLLLDASQHLHEKECEYAIERELCDKLQEEMRIIKSNKEKRDAILSDITKQKNSIELNEKELIDIVESESNIDADKLIEEEIAKCDTQINEKQAKKKANNEKIERLTVLKNSLPELEAKAKASIDNTKAVELKTIEQTKLDTVLFKLKTTIESEEKEIARLNQELLKVVEDGKKKREDEKNVPRCKNCDHPNHEYLEIIQKDIVEIGNKYRTIKADIENRTLALTTQKNTVNETQKAFNIIKEEIDTARKGINKSDENDYTQAILDTDNIKKIQGENADIDKSIELLRDKKANVNADKFKSKNDEKKKELKLKIEMEKKIVEDNRAKLLAIPETNVLPDVDGAISNLSLTNSTIAQLKEDTVRYSTQADMLKGQIKDMDTKKDILASAQIHKRYLTKLQYAFSKNGIPLYLISQYLPTLETLMNKRLSKVSDFTCSFDTKVVQAKGTIKDDLNIIINYVGGSDTVESLSGGQKSLIRLAFILAIAEMLRASSGVGFDFLALDESITGFDGDSEALCCEMIADEMEHISTFWMISHSKQVQDLFDTIVRVKKENGTSSIII